MPRIRSSSNPRSRVRLLSTPPQEAPVPKAVLVEGVRIPDPKMVELLLDAQRQGFRLEPSSGQGGHAAGTGFMVYPPDKQYPPISVGCVEVNSRHVANVRSNLRAVGYVPGGPVIDLTTTPATLTEQEPAMSTGRRKQAGAAKSDTGTRPLSDTSIADSLLGRYTLIPQGGVPGAITDPGDLFRGMTPQQRSDSVIKLVGQIAVAFGISSENAALIGALVPFMAEWDSSVGSATAARDNAYAEAAKEVEDALKLVFEADERTKAVEKKLAAAEKRGAETGRLLSEVQEQLASVTAERDELKKAIDPLRALFAGASKAS